MYKYFMHCLIFRSFKVENMAGPPRYIPVHSKLEIAKFRKQKIKEGLHILDRKAKTNIHRHAFLNNILPQIMVLQKINKKGCNLSFAYQMVIEFCIGKKKHFDDSCEYCNINQGQVFFIFHPKPKRSCFSCKCNHISMLTLRQILQRYPRLQYTSENIFKKLINQRKTIDLCNSTYYAVKHTYFAIEDIEKACEKHNIKIKPRPKIKYLPKRKIKDGESLYTVARRYEPQSIILYETHTCYAPQQLRKMFI